MGFEHNIAVERSIRSGEDKKVEVSVDGDKAVIRLSNYADGIGWFVQKTIIVEADLLDELVGQLSSARGSIKRECDDILSADVLEF